MKTEKQKEKRKQINNTRRSKFWSLINVRCVVCKESDPLLIDFHHVGPKKFRLSRLLSCSINAPLSSWPTSLISELRQCVPLCVVCHRRLHGGILTLTEEQAGARILVDEKILRKEFLECNKLT